MAVDSGLGLLREEYSQRILGLLQSGYTSYLPIGSVGGNEDTRDIHVEAGGGRLYGIDNVIRYHDHNPGTNVELLVRNGREIIPKFHGDAVRRAIENLDSTELHDLGVRIKEAEKSLKPSAT